MSGLVLADVSVHVGAKRLLEHAALTLEAGQFVALLGPNGAGKTTLLRTALGLVLPTEGEVRVDGTPLVQLSARERAAKVAWLPQSTAAAEPLPAREAVVAARYRFRETAVEARRAAEAALERVGLLEFADAPLTTLSGGERQRVAVAALLAQEARYLLLDEPANHLDPAQQAETYALLGELVTEGVGVLCVAHDVNLLGHVASPPRVVGLAAGTLRFELAYDAPELPLRLSELFDVPMLALPVGSTRVIVPAPPGATTS